MFRIIKTFYHSFPIYYLFISDGKICDVNDCSWSVVLVNLNVIFNSVVYWKHVLTPLYCAPYFYEAPFHALVSNLVSRKRFLMLTAISAYSIEDCSTVLHERDGQRYSIQYQKMESYGKHFCIEKDQFFIKLCKIWNTHKIDLFSTWTSPCDGSSLYFGNGQCIIKEISIVYFIVKMQGAKPILHDTYISQRFIDRLISSFLFVFQVRCKM